MHSPFGDMVHTDISTSPYGLAWIPNISGEITKKEHLSGVLKNKSITVNSRRMSIRLKNDGILILDESGMPCLTIVPCDCNGLCLIYAPKDVPSIDELSPEGVAFKFLVRGIWLKFRSLIDSCSDVCTCTAMDTILADGDNRYDCIAKRFTFVLENITDSALYAEFLSDDSDLIRKRTLRDEVMIRSNILFFQRFIEIYGCQISNTREYWSQIRCRKDKSTMISYYNSELRSIGQVEEIKELIESSNAVVGSIGRYTESINELSGSLVDSADRSKVFTYVSIGIAIVAVFVAIALDYL